MIGVCIILLHTGCISEKTTNYKATLYNHSGHDILIKFYIGGFVNSGDSILLNADEEIVIADGWYRGDVNAAGFLSNYGKNGSVDSATITYDGIYTVAHDVPPNPHSISGKVIIYENERNFLNSRKNYVFTREGSKRKGYTNVHKYTFTEADYEFAKD